MKLRGSHLVSLAILAGIGGWMFTGELIEGGKVDPNTKSIAEREATRTKEAFRVRVMELQPTDRVESLVIRGRTQANIMVAVKAETAGTVEARPVSKGQFVKPGDLLCVIDQGVRRANLEMAKATFNQAKSDFEANQELLRRGFATKSKLRSMQAALNTAEATLATAEQEMSRTEIRATVAGQVQEPMAEIGDNLAPGGMCLTLMNSDPMLFSGQVPERDVSSIKIGSEASIELVSGEKIGGKVRYLSPVADPNTRTFNLEIEIPNSDYSLRDGLTAISTINLAPVQAYQIQPSWLTLADDGRVGLRAVGADKLVRFIPVKIIAQDEKMAWVEGPTPGLKIIVLGQNFVSAGETVDPVTAEQLKALESATIKDAVENNS